MTDTYQEEGPSLVSTSKSENRINVLVMGHENSSKEKFVASLLHPKPFDPLVASEKKIQHKNHEYTLDFYLDSGFENTPYAIDEDIRECQAFIFVFNLYFYDTFESCSFLRDKIMRDKPRGNSPIFLVSMDHTITDQQPAVNFADAERFAESMGTKLYTINLNNSEKEIVNITSQIIEYVSDKSGPGGQEKEKLREVEILLLGDTFVGKTTIIKKLTSGTFSPLYTHTTDSVLYKHPLGVQGEVVLMKVWDTPGLHSGWTLKKEMIKSAQGFVFVYSVTSRQSFLEIKSLFKKLLSIKQDQIGEQCVLIGNRREELSLGIELGLGSGVGLGIERQVSYQEGEDLAFIMKCPFFEVTAKSASDLSSLWVSLVLSIRNRMKVPEKPVLGPLLLDLKGTLGKEGRKKGKFSPKFFSVKNGEISYSKDQFTSPKFTSGLHGGYVELGDTDPKTGYWFSVVLGEKRLNLTASSNEERERWTKVLNSNIMVNDIGVGLIDEVLVTMLWDIMGKKGPLPKALEKKVLDTSPLVSAVSSTSSLNLSSSGNEETKKKKGFFGKTRKSEDRLKRPTLKKN